MHTVALLKAARLLGLRIVRYGSLRRADLSSRGLLPSVVCLRVFNNYPSNLQCVGGIIITEKEYDGTLIITTEYPYTRTRS